MKPYNRSKEIKETEAEDAMRRQAAPEHDTEEFDSRELLIGLGKVPEFGFHFGLKLIDPDNPEKGWERDETAAYIKRELRNE